MTAYTNDKGTRWEVIKSVFFGRTYWRIARKRAKHSQWELLYDSFCESYKAQDALDKMAQRKGYKKFVSPSEIGDALHPNWWPECPYPKEIFPATGDDYITAIPDPRQRTAISGVLGREFWNIASDAIYRAYRTAIEDGDIVLREKP